PPPWRCASSVPGGASASRPTRSSASRSEKHCERVTNGHVAVTLAVGGTFRGGADMDTVTGHPLYDADGYKLGKIVDVLGLYGGADDIGWLAVKVGLRGTKLVPNTGVEPG